MIPAGFDYHAPRSVGDAIQLLGTLGSDAKLLAGGHSLLPMMKLRFAEPAHLIDLNEKVPLLPEAARQIGDPQVRNRGTIGGDIAHGDPGNDHPALAIALDAVLVLEGPHGSRQ